MIPFGVGASAPQNSRDRMQGVGRGMSLQRELSSQAPNPQYGANKEKFSIDKQISSNVQCAFKNNIKPDKTDLDKDPFSLFRDGVDQKTRGEMNREAFADQKMDELKCACDKCDCCIANNIQFGKHLKVAELAVRNSIAMYTQNRTTLSMTFANEGLVSTYEQFNTVTENSLVENLFVKPVNPLFSKVLKQWIQRTNTLQRINSNKKNPRDKRDAMLPTYLHQVYQPKNIVEQGAKESTKKPAKQDEMEGVMQDDVMEEVMEEFMQDDVMQDDVDKITDLDLGNYDENFDWKKMYFDLKVSTDIEKTEMLKQIQELEQKILDAKEETET